MKPFAALVWKDFQSMKWFLLFLFVTIPAAAAVNEAGIVLRYIGLAHIDSPNFQWAFGYSHAYGFILSVILVYALNIEMLSSTVHSALSLPVRRFLIMASKVAVIVAAAFALALLVLAIERFLAWKPFFLRLFPDYEIHYKSYLFIHRQELYTHGIVSPMYSFCGDFWKSYLYWARHLLLFPGMVCIAQGISAMVKRNRFAAWSMTFFIVFFLFSLFSNWCQDKFMFHIPVWVDMLDTEAGIVFLAMGLFIFDKASEV